MSGTIKQCSEAILKKMIKSHWPEYSISGSKPYRKGVEIKRISDHQVICTFRKNDEAYTTMLEAVTKNTGWYPERQDMLGLFKDLPDDVFKINKNSLVLFSTAKKALDLRKEVDELFRDLGVSSFSKTWERQLTTIIKKRRKYELLGSPYKSCTNSATNDATKQQSAKGSSRPRKRTKKELQPI